MRAREIGRLPRYINYPLVQLDCNDLKRTLERLATERGKKILNGMTCELDETCLRFVRVGSFVQFCGCFLSHNNIF